MPMRSYPRLTLAISGVGAALALVFGLLLLHPLLNGFPFLFPDFWGYSGACPDEMRSPVLGCAMRPFTWIGGNWAYAAVQCAATAFAMVLLWSRVLKRRHTGALVRGAARLGPGPVFRLGHGGRVDPDRAHRPVRHRQRAFPPGGRGPARLCLRRAFRQLPHLRHSGPGDAALGPRAGALCRPGGAVFSVGHRSCRRDEPDRRPDQVRIRQRVCFCRRAGSARHAGGPRAQMPGGSGFQVVPAQGRGPRLERREPPELHLGGALQPRSRTGRTTTACAGSWSFSACATCRAASTTMPRPRRGTPGGCCSSPSCPTGSSPSARIRSSRRTCASPSRKTWRPT